MVKENVLASAIGYGRFALYTLESFPLIYTRKIFGRNLAINPAPPEDQWKLLLSMVRALVEQDAQNIERGVYSLSLLYPEAPMSHARRYWEILVDSISAARRSRRNRHKDFSAEAAALGEGLPEYYLRNFHFQTDGYLSEKSAEIYDHQTEILFKGTISLMRRVLLAAVIEHINAQDKVVRVLELGCGAGESSEILLRSCSNIEMVSIDLSDPYLKQAKSKLAGFSNWRGVQAAAEDYLSDESYDVVFSCFLFHELPGNVRQQILQRCRENLVVGGHMWHIDSLQLNDNEALNWALLQFPKNFHEPFFTEYIKNPVPAPVGMSEIECETAFLAKSFHSQVKTHS